jgi:hypothetical protein
MHRSRMAFGFCAAVGAGWLIASSPLAGQTKASANEANGTWSVPRTAWGAPDLQGVWTNNNVTPMERPKALEGRTTLTPEEVSRLKANATRLFEGDGDAAFGDSIFVSALTGVDSFKSNDGGTGNYNQFWLVDREFDNRTSLIIDPPDGRMPALTAEAQQRQSSRASARRERPADGPEDRSLGERCITFGVPMAGAGYNSNYEILQTPTHVVIQLEMIHDNRIIPLDGRPHLGDGIQQWLGDSRGRWEGDTLVVETTNFSPKSGFRGSSEKLKLVERFRRVGPQSLQYEFTIDDAATFSRPWTAMIPLKRMDERIYEYACHEGNIGMVGILSGHRAQEQAVVERATEGTR